ncbi:MAG: 7,8-didemethyl-8-hydroxy-5-deazariboflavin synthase subunit CofG [Candidatus Alkanophagales archaeon]
MRAESGGRCVTFSKNVFIPVTNVCRNDCAYCGFRARHPRDAYLLDEAEVSRLLRAARRRGATEALFTLGEKPELSREFPQYRDWLRELGYGSTLEYLRALCELAVREGLLPHTNAGVLSYEELRYLRDINASMGLMLETIAPVRAHERSPGKRAELRLRTIEDAGRLRIPFTTGILVGIGETFSDIVASLEAIKRLHEKYGHIQEVIIQPFHPKPNTPMRDEKPPSVELMRRVVGVARRILPGEVAIQIPPNLVPLGRIIEFLEAGASDLGGISEVTLDYINPEAAWPSEEELAAAVRPFSLRERLPIYPRFVRRGWYSERLATLIRKYSDDEGFRRRN